MTVEPESGKALAEALVKQMTGGDTITARFLHREFFAFRPTFKLFLAANHRPRIVGTDEAIWDRIRLIPFTVRIAESAQDKTLLEKLRPELPGILRWAVEGCLAWQAEGLEPPEAIRRATTRYRVEMDAVGAFITECCAVAPGLTVPVGDLYRAYTAWCGERGPVDRIRRLRNRVKHDGVTPSPEDARTAAQEIEGFVRDAILAVTGRALEEITLLSLLADEEAKRDLAAAQEALSNSSIEDSCTFSAIAFERALFRFSKRLDRLDLGRDALGGLFDRIGEAAETAARRASPDFQAFAGELRRALATSYRNQIPSTPPHGPSCWLGSESTSRSCIASNRSRLSYTSPRAVRRGLPWVHAVWTPSGTRPSSRSTSSPGPCFGSTTGVGATRGTSPRPDRK